MKKIWTIVVSQNGWEYSGWVNITAVEVRQISYKKIIADGVEIEFDEEIMIKQALELLNLK